MRGGLDFYLGASGEVAHADSRNVEAGKAAPIEGGTAGGAWRMIVAEEVLASQDGIEYFLTEPRLQFKTVDLMTAMILVAIVGFATGTIIVVTLEQRTLEKCEVRPS
jgi:hypothetical protein